MNLDLNICTYVSVCKIILYNMRFNFYNLICKYLLLE